MWLVHQLPYISLITLYSCNRTVGCNRKPAIGQLKQPIVSQDEIAWFRGSETLRKHETLRFPLLPWTCHGNSVNGMLSLPVSVTFPWTDSNFYRPIKHIYKLLCNSCTTLPWSLDRPRTTKAHWRPLGVCVLRNYVKLRCFTRSYVHVNFGTLSKTCKIRSFKLSLCLYFKITAEFLIRAKKHFVFICKILLKSRQKSL